MGNISVNKLLIILICQAYRLGSLDFPFTNKWLIVFLLPLLLLLFSFVLLFLLFIFAGVKVTIDALCRLHEENIRN